MKKRFLWIWAALALLPLLLGADSPGKAASGVFDGGGLLEEQERAAIERLAAEAAEATGYSFVILTMDERLRGSYETYCETFFRNGVPGARGGQSGVLLYINLTDRDVYVACYDGALPYFPQSRLDRIRERITPDLTAGRYERACEVFLDETQTRFERGFWGRVDMSVLAVTTLIVAGLAMLLLWWLSRRGVHTSPPPPGVYIDEPSIRMLHKQDLFLRTHTTRTEIPQSSGGSGGGGGGGGGGSRGSGGKF